VIARERFGIAGQPRAARGFRAPLLLLHGHPRTHVTWHRVAPLLAPQFTLVCPDLRGYGESSKPPTTPDHAPYSKRAMAADGVALMRALGHDRFAVAGHDRGALVAFRLTMDRPDVVTRLVIMDGLPVVEHLEHRGADGRGGVRRLPPRDPRSRDRARHVRGLPGRPRHRPRARRGRPGSGTAGAVPDAPAVVDPDDMEELYGDPLAIWRAWADDVRGFGIDSGHHIGEDAPEALARALIEFAA
jgi:haloacetate dehalogenase